jgi:hypothetical protein
MAFPAIFNFNLYRGDSYDLVINPKQPNGTPFDLTGYGSSATFTIATERGNPEAVAGLGLAVIDNIAQTITCNIPPVLSTQLSGASYVYDIEIQNPSASTVYTLLTGNISITQDISRTGQA